jgi:hypothetical protein
MRTGLSIVSACLMLALPASAGPHLGMKLACKHYGDAWNSGSRSALYGQVTGDFAHQFRRMPNDLFADMPRGGGGKVLSHTKGAGSGRVTVATSQGVMTFVLVGSGFNWRVADIYKAGDDGRTVSLKSYLDATMTSREFMRDLKERQGTEFYASLSSSFRSSFRDLDRSELVIIRELVGNSQLIGKPFVSMHGSSATLDVRLSGDKRARMTLVREGSWKVDDYSVQSPTMTIASFRRSLQTLVAVQRFREFMQTPSSTDPRLFTAKGNLQDSLVRVHELGFLPMHQKPSPMRHCTIDASGRLVSIDLTDRHCKIQMASTGRELRIAKVDVTMGNRWADLGHLIALNERVRGSLAIMNLTQPRIRQAATIAEVTKESATEPSVLTNASAEEPVVATKPATVVAKPAAAVSYADSIPVTTATVVKPVIKTASYSQATSHPTRTYKTRPMKKFRRR